MLSFFRQKNSSLFFQQAEKGSPAMFLSDHEAPIHKKSFNFGIRKPMECVVDKKTNQEIKETKRGRLNKNIYHDDIWMNYLLGKWVYTYDRTYGCNIYFKHILQDKRIYQIVYSGMDIMGDGLYLLYKVDLYTQVQQNNKKAFYVMPTMYDILKGSFECRDFLQEMIDDGWMTEEDIRIVKLPIAKADKILSMMDDELMDKRKAMKLKLNERKREERRAALEKELQDVPSGGNIKPCIK